MADPTPPTVFELMTEPDVIEAAEKLAEQFRSSLYENADLEELADTILPSYIVNRDDDRDGEASGPAYEQGQKNLAEAVATMLKPMIAAIFDKGDWTTRNILEPHLNPNRNVNVPGEGMYKVTYRTQLGNDQWYEFIMVAKFTGVAERGDIYFFSGRPVFGTVSIQLSCISKMEQISGTAVSKRPVRQFKVPAPGA